MMGDKTSRVRETLAGIAGVAALVASGILITGIVGLIAGLRAWRPWLAVLFGIDARVGGVSMETLHAIAPVDIALLALIASVFAGFWPGPGRPRRFWLGFAVLLPVAGIAVLTATGLAGRSGLMGGLLVLSCLMLGDGASRMLGYWGIAASLLLLIGDFTTVGTPSALVAGVIAGGYLLLIAWLLSAGCGLLGWQHRRQWSATDTGRALSASSRVGGLKGLSRITGEIVIGRQVGEVFDFVADERNEPRFNKQMTSVEQLSGGEIGLGTRFKADLMSMGRPLSMVIEFTQFDRPARLGSRTTMPGIVILGELTFEAVGDATRMRWAWDMQPAGVMRLFKPVIVAVGRRQERGIWTGLKRYLEA